MQDHGLRHAQVRVKQDPLQGLIQVNLRICQASGFHMVRLYLHSTTQNRRQTIPRPTQNRFKIKQMRFLPIPCPLQISGSWSRLRRYPRFVTTQGHEEEEASLLVVTQGQPDY